MSKPLKEKDVFRYELPQSSPGAPARWRVVVTPDGRPWLVGGAVITIPAATPLVRGRLTCEVCGEVVATGPTAETEAWAAFELGSTDTRGFAHFQTCTEARLVLSFVLSDPPGDN